MHEEKQHSYSFVHHFRSGTARASLAFVLLFSGATALAAKRPAATVPELFAASGAVFVGTVEEVDEDAAMKAGKFDPRKSESIDGALTRITFSVEEVLFGDVPTRQVELVVRGGLLPDRSFEEWSTVPVFSAGDRYVVFVRAGDFTIQPFVRAEGSVLRFVETGERSVLVDENGRGLVQRKDGALGWTMRVAETMKARRIAQRRSLQSSHAVIDPESSAHSELANDAGDAAELVAMFRREARRERESKVSHEETLIVKKPGPLSGTIGPDAK
jgi:hypothetical protein